MMCRCRPCPLGIKGGCRDRFLVAAIAESLFVWGGSYVHFLERFSPTSGHWDVFNMPHSVPRPLIPLPSATALQGCVYVIFGGWDRSPTEVLGPPVRFCAATEQWEVLPRMPPASGTALCCSMGGSVYSIASDTSNLTTRFQPKSG